MQNNFIPLFKLLKGFIGDNFGFEVALAGVLESLNFCDLLLFLEVEFIMHIELLFLSGTGIFFKNLDALMISIILFICICS